MTDNPLATSLKRVHFEEGLQKRILENLSAYEEKKSLQPWAMMVLFTSLVTIVILWLLEKRKTHVD